MTGVEQSVLYMKVTEALREDSPDKLTEFSKTYNIADFPGLLSLAVELSSLETVRWVIRVYESKGKNMNEVEAETGNTALHKAVLTNRAEIVRELMLNPLIDDTVRNKSGLTAPELASDPEIEHVVSAAENKFAQQMAVRLKAAFKNHDLDELNKIYRNPRVSVNLNINGTDPDTGRTVLHDAAGANDLRLVQFILAHGGDPLVRDRSTRKLAEDMTTSDEIRKALNNSAKSKAILDQTGSKSTPGTRKPLPSMEGYLKKWTNITSGYKLRWFVLKNGELSYFKRPEEAKSGDRYIRGSIGLRHAAVKLDSSEKNKFEIRTPSTRFHLKASHPAETNKWVWALQNAITTVRDEEKGKAATKKKSAHVSKDEASATSGVLAADVATAATQPASAETANIPTSPAQSQSSVAPRSHLRAVSAAGSTDGDGWLVNDLNTKGDDDSSEDDYGADDAITKGPQISAESIIARLGAVKDLMTMLVFQVNDETMRDAIATAQGSVDVLSSDVVMLQRQAQAHLRKLKLDLERSDKGQRDWASNYRDLQVQYEILEGQLHSLRKRHASTNSLEDDDDDDDEFFDTVDSHQQLESSSNKAAQHAAPEPKAGITEQPAKSTGAAKHHDESGENQGRSSTPDVAGAAAVGAVTGAAGIDGEHNKSSSSPPREGKSSESQTSTSESQLQRDVVEKFKKEKTFVGYEKPPRDRLALDADNRPRMSLWGILKNLIGKDMTKMTLPVTFNECTSLLQRSAEDMEYVDLLDRAAEAIDDGGLRMAYVAAFAGSSYSSTINRIAKPFNPLLGETYEYARPELGYRLMAEQVSHHPPIGALMAESKTWDFYGESNVESKFYGRSFDINPLGLWYVNLRPNKGADVESELYSFRKLTSSVVGIMLGNPIVDNYGDMKITNHTTGINAIISYKARGWRGSSAYKLQGRICDKAGQELWTVGGQWDDKIWAKKAGTEEKILLWKAHPRHKVPFNLTDFAITLNDLPDSLKPWLPPTDTRLRPDQRAMEEGRYDDAGDEKNRVEEKQRAKRRERESKGIKHESQWFTLEKHPITGLDYYKPINNYWAQRGEKKLADKGDIF